ncbi:MAG TPA: hypothetical protein VKY85_01310 [Candidatus Angelobacter sp.]|nr:hypothetical protein [Candidatus Angelobacter sp.]
MAHLSSAELTPAKLKQLKQIEIGTEIYTVSVYPSSASGKISQAKPERDDTVGVYYPNSNTPEPWRMDAESARDLVRHGHAIVINSKRKRFDIRLRVRPAFQRTAPTIKMSEMEAAAGAQAFPDSGSRTLWLTEARKRELLHKKKIRKAEDFVERSLAKVKLWPLIGDNKAVRVGPAATQDAYAFAGWLQREHNRDSHGEMGGDVSEKSPMEANWL